MSTLSGVSGRRVETRPDDLAEALGCVADDLQRRCGAGRGVDRLLDELGGGADRAADASQNEFHRRGLGLRLPWLEVGRGGCRRRLEVEQDGRQIDAGDAVDERVVGLEDEREAIVLEPFDQPALPQRLGAIELLGDDPARELEQLLLGSGRGERRVAHVVLEIERWVVGPQRAAGLERRRAQPLPVARHEVQAAADMIQVVLECRWRPIEDEHRADVHVRRLPFLMQERRVDRSQAVEMLLRHTWSLPNSSRASSRLRVERMPSTSSDGRLRRRL